MNENFSHLDITIEYSECNLIIANTCIRREFVFESGSWRTVSICDASGKEYASKDNQLCDFHFIGLGYPENEVHLLKWTNVECKVVSGDFSDAEHVEVAVTFWDSYQQVEYVMTYFVYPAFPVIGCQGRVKSEVMPNIYWSHRGRLINSQDPRNFHDSVTDSFVSAANIKPRYTVEFTARTDYTDNLVIRRNIAGDGEYNGNILVSEDDSKHGAAFIQEAPPSAERRDFESYDFTVRDGRISSCGWGIPPEELKPGKVFVGYRTVLLLFENELDFEQKLKNYLRLRFKSDPAQAYAVTVNPWGCGKFRTLVNQEFLLEEIRAAAETGASHYQIDDGWQAGGWLADLAVYNRKLNNDFWQVSDMLGGNLDRLMEEFAKCGINPSLWVAPAFNTEFRDYKEFADMVLGYYRKHNIKVFKVDGVKMRTYESEENLRNLLHDIRTSSNGEIVFNLDTTNGQRSGYFLFLEYGNIFLENRYVCHQWGVGYHPERTLRNFWKLARYMRSEMLQIEVANPGDLNPDFYARKGETLPTVYDFEYWVAVTMFGNPLIWMTPSRIAVEHRATLKKLMTLHRQEAETIFSGTVFPVGDMPSGAAFTGFASVGEKFVELIVYREKDEQSGKAAIAIPGVTNSCDCLSTLAGNGSCEVKDGTAYISIPNAPGYLWVKWSR